MILQLTFLGGTTPISVLNQTKEKSYVDLLIKTPGEKAVAKYSHWLPQLLDQAQKNAGLGGETFYFLNFLVATANNGKYKHILRITLSFAEWDHT